jgi:hypothetical protein
MDRSVWIGWEPREVSAFAVARHSLRRHHGNRFTPDFGVVQSKLRKEGLYTRPHSWRDTQMWDDISDAPCATEFANSRFLVPHLARGNARPSNHPRWAVFMDCDMLVRRDIMGLFDVCRSDKAVMVVKHHHEPTSLLKMIDQIQTRYFRKNWSSVCAFNLNHPANEKLTPELVNTVPGRDLHRFCWLDDDDIGELPPEWNYLVGHSDPAIDPAIVHFTDGIPPMAGYEHCEYADEWNAELENWAAR